MAQDLSHFTISQSIMDHPLSGRLLRAGLLWLCLLLVGMGVFSRRGVLDWRRMVSRNEDLSKKTAQLRLEQAEWRKRTDLLLSSPREQERLIRDTLGYVQPKETVIEFE